MKSSLVKQILLYYAMFFHSNFLTGLLFLASSTSETPKKVKPQLSHDVGPVGIRVKKGRKTTEEEEGEIVSDPSDSESRRGEKRARRYSSISNPDAESEKPKYEESKERGMEISNK